MKIEFRPITAAVIAVVLVSAAVADGARSRRLDEDAALALFERTLKHGPVYDKRISWDVSRSAPKRQPMLILILWVRAIHNAKCGGAPETSPTIDRYRVYRRSSKFTQREAAED